MSYWQALGLPGYPLSEGVETLAQWIQWAMAGVNSGIGGETLVTTNPLTAKWYKTEDVIRYNLNEFWNAKGPILAQASTDGEKAQIYRLDAMSHGILNAVDSGKLYSESPSYWEYWKSWWTGGTPTRPSTQTIADEARRAALDAADASRAAGLPTMASYYEQAAANVENQVMDSNSFWSQEGALNVAGVPWWAWILGGVGVILAWRKL